MREAGQLVLFANHRGSRWALPSYQVGLQPDTTEPLGEDAAIDACLDDLDVVSDADVDDEALELPPDEKPPLRRVPSAKKALRQPHERPGHVALSVDRQPSWWVSLDRAQLEAAARERQEQMRGSKENLKVPSRRWRSKKASGSSKAKTARSGSSTAAQ